MVNSLIMYGWIEAAVRYSGTFGPQEKVVYQQIFGVSEPTTSRHQSDFAEQFESACGDDVFQRRADTSLTKGRLALLEGARLPTVPVFKKMPTLERWLQDALGNRFVKIEIQRSVPRQLIVRAVLQSIWSKVPLRVLYHSRSGTRERVISPHTIVKATGRLHVRAFDHLTNDGRDFVLSRIGTAILVQHEELSYIGSKDDRSWTQFQTVIIEAKDFEADEALREGVALDFDLPDCGRREMRVREPLLRYLVDEMSAGYMSPVRIYEKEPP